MFSEFYTRKETIMKQTPDNLRASLFRDLNTTLVVKDSLAFRNTNRKWDFKVLDKQLEEIFSTLLFRREDRMSTNGIRNYMEIFMNQYQKCDADGDNVLNIAEFTACMTNDMYLKYIMPTPKMYAANVNYTTPAVFYTALFNILNERHEGYVNFVGYMRVRLMTYSWKECSIMSPFLEEIDFECAIEIASGYRTLSRTTARNIFKLALDLSNNASLRNLDFISYFIIAESTRLYGKINSKEDNDISRSEMNLALDDNLLPIRYNQDVIDQLFTLLDDYDKPNQGIDFESFVYYDFVLQLFTFNNKTRPYFLNINEFTNVINNPLFPNKTLNEIYFIPAYVLSPVSYNTYQYLNVSQYITEGDYFYKFLEVSSKVKTEKSSKLNSENRRRNYPINPLMRDGISNLFNTTVNISTTIQLIFNTLDYDLDGWINFYDFGTFMQIAIIFSKTDEYNKGRLVAGILNEHLKNYADFPAISYRVREKSEKFSFFDQNAYVDLLSAVQIIKIEEMAKFFIRKTDKATVNEIELKKLLSKVNMKYVPDTYYHRCLRGLDSMSLPKYDWECCFVQGMTLNLKYYEAMNNYKDAQLNNITLLNTVFYNIDPNYQ
jgi:hypothetical protein